LGRLPTSASQAKTSSGEASMAWPHPARLKTNAAKARPASPLTLINESNWCARVSPVSSIIYATLRGRPLRGL